MNAACIEFGGKSIGKLIVHDTLVSLTVLFLILSVVTDAVMTV